MLGKTLVSYLHSLGKRKCQVIFLSLKCNDIFHLHRSHSHSQDIAFAFSIYLLSHMEGKFQTVIMCVRLAVRLEIFVVFFENMSVLRLIQSHSSPVEKGTRNVSSSSYCLQWVPCLLHVMVLNQVASLVIHLHDSHHGLAIFPYRCLCARHAGRNVLLALTSSLMSHLNAKAYLNRRQLVSALPHPFHCSYTSSNCTCLSFCTICQALRAFNSLAHGQIQL